jgi:hypothetical protein
MKPYLSISLFLTLAFGSIAFAQQSGSLPSSLSESQQVDNSQQTGQSLAEQARRIRKDHSEETKLTPADAKELFAAVDRISAFASEDSGMTLHVSVKRRIIGPDDVEKLTRERLSGKDYDDRFARSELTMKKFGLLPRTFDLKEFIIKVRRKDLAGYYDDETKTISLLNTVPLEEMRAILAHELTHALQDQNYDLQKWMKAGVLLNSKNQPIRESDESMVARHAVVEGQAMVVFADYVLAPTGRSLLNSPGLIYRMEDPAVKGARDSQLLHDAPIILRATGTFPYHEGLIFEGELLQAGGKKMAFAGVFANPPRNTHEVMQPRAYLAREKPVSLPFPDAHSLLGDSYEIYDSGSVGELDVRALLWQLGTRTLADDLSKSWLGGAYMAFRKKAAAVPTTGDIELFYVSRWNSAIAAERFAKFYVDSVPRRYEKAEVSASSPCSASECPKAISEIETEEGPVIVELWKDNTVVVSESFDKETAAKLSAATRTADHKNVADATFQQEIGSRLYDVPAFRRLQEGLREETLRQIALENR